MTQGQAGVDRAQALADPAAFDEIADPVLRRVLRTYLVRGQLPVVPRGVKRSLLLEYLATAFEPGVRYSETEVNADRRRCGTRTWRRYGGTWSMRAAGPAGQRVLAMWGMGMTGGLASTGPSASPAGPTGPSVRSAVSPFYVMQVFQAAESRRRLGLPVYNLAIGQPGTPAPIPVREAARQALAEHRIGYTDALGLPQLREAIAEHARAWYGIDVPVANVVVTTGSSGGFLAAFLAAFDAGDAVAMPRPGYPAYRNILASLGCTVREFACGPEHGSCRVRDAAGAGPGAGRADPRLARQPDRRDGAAGMSWPRSRPGAGHRASG